MWTRFLPSPTDISKCRLTRPKLDHELTQLGGTTHAMELSATALQKALFFITPTSERGRRPRLSTACGTLLCTRNADIPSERFATINQPILGFWNKCTYRRRHHHCLRRCRPGETFGIYSNFSPRSMRFMTALVLKRPGRFYRPDVILRSRRTTHKIIIYLYSYYDFEVSAF